MRTGSPTRLENPARDVRRAWWSLALFPVTFVASFVVGEGLATLLGYESGSSEAPAWYVPAVVAPVALLVFALPALLSTWFGLRAHRAGHQGGLVPVIVAWGLAGGFALLNLLALAVQLVQG